MRAAFIRLKDNSRVALFEGGVYIRKYNNGMLVVSLFSIKFCKHSFVNLFAKIMKST